MNDFLKAKRLEVFVIVVIIALIGIVYAFTRTQVSAPTISQNQTSNQIATQTGAQTVTYQGQDGKSALVLLQSMHQVQVQHFSFGDEVMSIDGVTPDNSTAYWEFMVNGKDSPVGASTYITKSTDAITWRVSKIYPATAQ
jgi:hypothetical protein